jgi:hypothetical protein
MFSWARKQKENAAPATPAVPTLDLSGPRLRFFLESLLDAAEREGGIERYVSALALKAVLFQDVLGKGRVEEMTAAEFNDLCAFITPARRRVGAWLGEFGFARMQEALVELLTGWSDTATTDTRMARFRTYFPDEKNHRFARDLAAEVLHFTAPDYYPLMTRWMWDAKANTGTLREIWYGDNVDAMTIDAGDDFLTHKTLRDELTGFLADNGVFRDIPLYVDLLCAHVYAAYIDDRGGQFLRSDFQAPQDPMLHTRRLLGLDGIDSESGRTRLKLIDGSAHVVDTPKLLN